METKRISRREFLQMTALGVAGAALSSCACESTPTEPPTELPPEPIATPRPALGPENVPATQTAVAEQEAWEREQFYISREIQIGEDTVKFYFSKEDFEKEENEPLMEDIEAVCHWFSENYEGAVNEEVFICLTEGGLSSALVEEDIGRIWLGEEQMRGDENEKKWTMANELSTALTARAENFENLSKPHEWTDLLFGEAWSTLDATLFSLAPVEKGGLGLSWDDLREMNSNYTDFLYDQEVFKYIPPQLLYINLRQGVFSEHPLIQDIVIVNWEKAATTASFTALARNKPENLSFKAYLEDKTWINDAIEGRREMVKGLKTDSDLSYLDWLATYNQVAFNRAAAEFSYLNYRNIEGQDDDRIRPCFLANRTDEEDEIALMFFVGGPNEANQPRPLAFPLNKVMGSEVYYYQATLTFFDEDGNEREITNLVDRDLLAWWKIPKEIGFNGMIKGVKVQNAKVDLDTNGDGQIDPDLQGIAIPFTASDGQRYWTINFPLLDQKIKNGRLQPLAPEDGFLGRPANLEMEKQTRLF